MRFPSNILSISMSEGKLLKGKTKLLRKSLIKIDSISKWTSDAVRLKSFTISKKLMHEGSFRDFKKLM